MYFLESRCNKFFTPHSLFCKTLLHLSNDFPKEKKKTVRNDQRAVRYKRLQKAMEIAYAHSNVNVNVNVEIEGTNIHVLFTLAFCSGLGHQHTKGADGSRYQSIYEPTEPSQPMMSDDVSDENRPQHRELRPLLFSNSVWVL